VSEHGATSQKKGRKRGEGKPPQGGVWGTLWTQKSIQEGKKLK